MEIKPIGVEIEESSPNNDKIVEYCSYGKDCVVVRSINNGIEGDFELITKNEFRLFEVRYSFSEVKIVENAHLREWYDRHFNLAYLPFRNDQFNGFYTLCLALGEDLFVGNEKTGKVEYFPCYLSDPYYREILVEELKNISKVVDIKQCHKDVSANLQRNYGTKKIKEFNYNVLEFISRNFDFAKYSFTMIEWETGDCIVDSGGVDCLIGNVHNMSEALMLHLISSHITGCLYPTTGNKVDTPLPELKTTLNLDMLKKYSKVYISYSYILMISNQGVHQLDLNTKVVGCIKDTIIRLFPDNTVFLKSDSEIERFMVRKEIPGYEV